MGDPGMPMMAGLLAVPVGVLLFVIVLALIGGRWAAPAPVAEAAPMEDLAEPVPYDEPWGYYDPPSRPPAIAPPAQERRLALPAPAQESRRALPPSQGPRYALPPARPAVEERRLALPPARPAYSSYAPEPYGQAAERAPYERPADRDPYARDYARDPYARDPYAPRETYGRPDERDPYDASGPYDGSAEPDQSSRQRFPYGPYRHQ